MFYSVHSENIFIEKRMQRCVDPIDKKEGEGIKITEVMCHTLTVIEHRYTDTCFLFSDAMIFIPYALILYCTHQSFLFCFLQVWPVRI